MKGQGWRTIPTHDGKPVIYEPQPWPPFSSAAIQKKKAIERLV